MTNWSHTFHNFLGWLKAISCTNNITKFRKNAIFFIARSLSTYHTMFDPSYFTFSDLNIPKCHLLHSKSIWSTLEGWKSEEGKCDGRFVSFPTDPGIYNIDSGLISVFRLCRTSVKNVVLEKRCEIFSLEKLNFLTLIHIMASSGKLINYASDVIVILHCNDKVTAVNNLPTSIVGSPFQRVLKFVHFLLVEYWRPHKFSEESTDNLN